MKIKKAELLSALEIAQKFVSKGNETYAALKTVMIDGPGCQIIATNLNHRCIVDVAIIDAMQSVEKSRPEVVMPAEAFKKELETLKVDQLKDLSEYAGLPPEGKKAEMVQAIFDASVQSAEIEKAKPVELEAVPEIVCVEPGHLLKIVKSLKEVKDEDDVEIAVEEFFEDKMYNEHYPGSISVGQHFQRLTCRPPRDFPDGMEFEGGKAYLSIDGNSLSMATAADQKGTEDTRPHITRMFFDSSSGGIATTDGTRLHLVKAKLLKKSGDIYPPKKTVRALASIAKEKDIKVSVNNDSTMVLFELGQKAKVYVRNDNKVDFPPYRDLIGAEVGHTVTIKAEDLQGVLKQAALMVDKDFKGITCTFNGTINARVHNPNKGEYERFNVPIAKGEVEPEVEIMLDVEKLASTCGRLKDDIEISLTDAEHPLHIRTPDKKFQAVVMPIRM